MHRRAPPVTDSPPILAYQNGTQFERVFGDTITLRPPPPWPAILFNCAGMVLTGLGAAGLIVGALLTVIEEHNFVWTVAHVVIGALILAAIARGLLGKVLRLSRYGRSPIGIRVEPDRLQISNPSAWGPEARSFMADNLVDIRLRHGGRSITGAKRQSIVLDFVEGPMCQIDFVAPDAAATAVHRAIITGVRSQQQPA
jgi:hypothetical protein